MPRNRNVVRSGSRPRYVWVPARDVENTTIATTTQSIDLLGNYLNDAGRATGPGMVVERILGSLIVEASTIGSGGDFAFGIITAPEGGFATLPDPIAEINDYLVWISGVCSDEASETAAGVFHAKQLVYQFDVRSRRKLHSIGDGVFGLFRNANAVTMLWSVNTRILMRVS